MSENEPGTEKGVSLTELKKDLAQLQQQMVAISGAIQYIQRKIAQLSKMEE